MKSVKKSAYSPDYFFIYRETTLIKVETKTGDVLRSALDDDGDNHPNEICESLDGEYVMVLMTKTNIPTGPTDTDYGFMIMLDKEFNFASHEWSINSDISGQLIYPSACAQVPDGSEYKFIIGGVTFDRLDELNEAKSREYLLH